MWMVVQRLEDDGFSVGLPVDVLELVAVRRAEVDFLMHLAIHLVLAVDPVVCRERQEPGPAVLGGGWEPIQGAYVDQGILDFFAFWLLWEFVKWAWQGVDSTQRQAGSVVVQVNMTIFESDWRFRMRLPDLGERRAFVTYELS